MAAVHKNIFILYIFHDSETHSINMLINYHVRPVKAFVLSLMQPPVIFSNLIFFFNETSKTQSLFTGWKK